MNKLDWSWVPKNIENDIVLQYLKSTIEPQEVTFGSSPVEFIARSQDKALIEHYNIMEENIEPLVVEHINAKKQYFNFLIWSLVNQQIPMEDGRYTIRSVSSVMTKDRYNYFNKFAQYGIDELYSFEGDELINLMYTVPPILVRERKNDGTLILPCDNKEEIESLKEQYLQF